MRQTQWERASPPVGLSHADGFDGLSQLARRDAPDFDLILASARRSWIHQPALFSRVNLRLARRVVPGHGGAWAFQPLSGRPKSRSNRAKPIRLLSSEGWPTPAGATRLRARPQAPSAPESAQAGSRGAPSARARPAGPRARLAGMPQATRRPGRHAGTSHQDVRVG